MSNNKNSTNCNPYAHIRFADSSLEKALETMLRETRPKEQKRSTRRFCML